MEINKKLYSDIYHVILVLNETVINPAPRKQILKYTKELGRRKGRIYLYSDIDEHLQYMVSQKLVRKDNEDCYEVY